MTDQELEDLKIATLYIAEKKPAAQMLGRYRAASAATNQLYAAAAYQAAQAGGYAASREMQRLERLLASIEVGSAAAEVEYQAWRKEHIETITETCDLRFYVDLLGSEGTVRNWAKNALAGPSQGEPVAWNDAAQLEHEPKWRDVARVFRVVCTVDLVEDPEEGEPREMDPKVVATLKGTSSDTIWYRQPRDVMLKVWTLEVNESNPEELLPRLKEKQRVLFAYPGNEKSIKFTSADDSARAVALTINEDGSLVKIVTDMTDASLQRAKDASALVSSISTAAKAGADIRAAFSPPSLVDQAAERAAARELGLIPSPEDPLESVRKQLEEAKLRAQLKIAQQIAQSETLPILLQFNDS